MGPASLGVHHHEHILGGSLRLQRMVNLGVQVLERVTPGKREKEKVRAKENPRESPPHRGHQSRRRKRLRVSWPEMFLGCIVF